MGHKHLHELLQEDQEPFHLKKFIADRRSQLRSTTTGSGKSVIVVRKRKPTINSTFCVKHVCLFSSQNSPEFRKSPFLDFPAKDSKSPCNNAAVFLHIPARTAGMLLDAATRVQKPKPGSKQFKFGLLGSFFRRLKDRSSGSKSREIEPDNGASSSPVTGKFQKKPEKSSVMETSCSSRAVDEIEEINCLCSNSSSPFHFSLLTSPSPTRRKPVCSSPAAFQQDKESHQTEEMNRQDNDEKEQCSPVSVLDPLFDEDEDAEDDGYDIECSYANVQRAKHKLLQKLKRFERLAGLDPIDLENRMLEQCSSDDEDVLASGEEVSTEECFREIVNHLGVGKIPWYMKNLVFDLIEEEKSEELHKIVQRVCKRLYSWKVVELNTIDMIVETDFKSEGWRWCDKESIRDVGIDIEMAIFGLLMEELSHELVF